MSFKIKITSKIVIDSYTMHEQAKDYDERYTNYRFGRVPKKSFDKVLAVFSDAHYYRKHCDDCNFTLNTHYVYIITKLIEAELLPNDYKTKCCRCR